jgi:RimJ/RimL family protein N-acetyltransferase
LAGAGAAARNISAANFRADAGAAGVLDGGGGKVGYQTVYAVKQREMTAQYIRRMGYSELESDSYMTKIEQHVRVLAFESQSENYKRPLPGSLLFYYGRLDRESKFGELQVQYKFQADVSGSKRPADDADVNYAMTEREFSIRSVMHKDKHFYYKLFGNSDVMKYYGNGKTRDSEDVEKRIDDSILNRFQQGKPNGLLTICNAKGDPIGFSVVGQGGRPGSSEIAGAFGPSLWNQGIGSACAATLDWYAWEVRRIGLGIGFQERDELTCYVESFKYSGVVLDQLESTSCPSNYASCKILREREFHQAELDLTDKRIDLTSGAYEGGGGDLTSTALASEREQNFANKFYEELDKKMRADESLLTGERIAVQHYDHLNQVVESTASWKREYDRVKLHWEKNVESLEFSSDLAD